MKFRDSLIIYFIMTIFLFLLFSSCQSNRKKPVNISNPTTSNYPTITPTTSKTKNSFSTQMSTTSTPTTIPSIKPKFLLGDIHQETFWVEGSTVENQRFPIDQDVVFELINKEGNFVDNEIEQNIQFMITEFTDQNKNAWLNILVGLSMNEPSDHFEEIWLYTELDETGTQLLPPGKGTESILIPIDLTYQLKSGEIATLSGDHQHPDKLLYNLQIEGDDNSLNLISIDLEAKSIRYTDPWTGYSFDLSQQDNLALLARIIPIEPKLFSGISNKNIREVLSEGLLPEKDKAGNWVALNERKEIVKIWDKEGEKWTTQKLKVTMKAKKNVERWLSGEKFNYTKDALFRWTGNSWNMKPRPIGFYKIREHSEINGHITVFTQGVLLGFGSQEREFEYKGDTYIFYEKIMLLGFEDQQTGERFFYPGVYGSYTSYDIPKSPLKVHVNWKTAKRPLITGGGIKLGEYSYEEFPDALNHVVGKPIAIEYSIVNNLEDMRFGDGKNTYTGKELEEAIESGQVNEEWEYGYFLYKKYVRNIDDKILERLQGKIESVEQMKKRDFSKEMNTVFIGRIFAPLEE